MRDLRKASGLPCWPGAALLYVGAAVVGLVGILATRETWGPRERAEVAQLLRAHDAATSATVSPPAGRS